MIILLCLLVFVLIDIVIILYDGYRYPACPLCGDHMVRVFPGEFVCAKRVQGKIICPIHGEIRKEKVE